MAKNSIKVASEADTHRDMLARHIIHVLVAAAVVVPLVWKFDLPGAPSGQVEAVYDGLDALPAGSTVLFSLDYDPAAKAELYPMSLAMMRHCFEKDLHPIVMTFVPAGVNLHKEIVQQAASEYNKKPGEDYALLGFKPGGASLILNMAENLTAAFDQDIFENSTEGMPALEGVQSIKDIDYGVVIAAGETVRTWIVFGGDRCGFPLGAGCTAVIAPDLYPFVQSEQLTGILGGLRGAYDYEMLIDKKGQAAEGMASQSLTHVLIILLIIVANAKMFIKRFEPKGGDIA